MPPSCCGSHLATIQTLMFYFCFRFELLEVLTFDSVRRRMSVIVKSTTGMVSPNMAGADYVLMGNSFGSLKV